MTTVKLSSTPQRKRQFQIVRQQHGVSKDKTSSLTPKSLITSRKQTTQREQSHFNNHALICVSCYNRKQAKNKTYFKQSTGINSNFIPEHDTKSISKEQLKKIQDYNFQQSQNKKSLSQRLKTVERQAKQKQNQQYFEENRIKQYKKKLHLKIALEAQIVEKQNKKKQKNQEQKNQSMSPIIGKNRNDLRQKELKYRAELLQQIKNKPNQHNINKQNFYQKQLGQQQQQKQQQKNRLKKKYLKQIFDKDQCLRKQLQQTLKTNRKNQRIIGQNQRKLQKLEIEQEQRHKQQRRREKINDYLEGLKQQIQVNRSKRKNEAQKMQEDTVKCIVPQRIREQNLNCNQCSRKYPRNDINDDNAYKIMQSEKTRAVTMKGVAFKAFALIQQPNLGVRSYMEDRAFLCDCYMENPKSALFGVFDGHGGYSVAGYLQQHFPNILRTRKDKSKKKMLQEAFLQADKAIIDHELDSGSTGTVLYLGYEDASHVLYTANVGDSAAYLFDDNSYQKLTTDHRGSNKAECIRVKECGGQLINGRLQGLLAVTRAFGDTPLKQFGLTAMPDVRRIQLRLTHKIILVASDGLWDFVSLPAIQKIIKTNEGQVDFIAKKIIKLAIQNGSQDNISVIVIKI